MKHPDCKTCNGTGARARVPIPILDLRPSVYSHEKIWGGDDLGGKSRRRHNLGGIPPHSPPDGRKPGTPQINSQSRIELLDPENLAGGIKIREFHKIKNTPVVV